MDSTVSYGGTTVLVSRDSCEPLDVYTERSWCIAKALEKGSHGTLSELVHLSRFFAYKKVFGVVYNDRFEKRMRDVFG